MARTVDPDKHQARRAQILHAAASLFATRGFEATTTAEICRVARISSGNLFHYFPTKRDLFAALVTDDAGDTRRRLADALSRDDPWEGLLGFVDDLTEAATEPVVPGLVLEAMLQAHRDPDLAELLADDATDERAGIRQLLGRVAEAGGIDPDLDLDEVAAWIMAMVGAVYLAGATSDDADPVAQRRLLRRTLQRLLGPSG